MHRDSPQPINPRSALNRTGLGRHFLQIPGPSNVPDRVLRAMDFPTIDHRGPEFAALATRILSAIRPVFGTQQPVIIYAGSGTGAWEAALVNTLSPGDKVLMVDSGHFATLWKSLAVKLGLEPICLDADWSQPIDPQAIEDALKADTAGAIRAVCVVHNETSTGVISDIGAIRTAIDAARHPALLMIDTVSSLGCAPVEHDAWGVDVTVSGSQKGLMLPPGLCFNAVSEKALAAQSHARLPRAYWRWDEVLKANEKGSWPSTPATNLLYGLAEALDLIQEEGLDAIFKRHRRHAAATRAAVQAWGLRTVCEDPRAHSPIVTAVRMPEVQGKALVNADTFREQALTHFNLSLGTGLSKLSGRVFRLGHLGDFNDLSLLGMLGGVEMTLQMTQTPHSPGGVQAAINYLSEASSALANTRPMAAA
ncbi:MAG: pyridoxal-phosphate-dependent aminotransferase family protein [Burkholderiaceae bacterium]|jgi:alanine-glyoxylate transaminase/serine-glyoxylate transaminase/serine-pyruvate transaminase